MRRNRKECEVKRLWHRMIVAVCVLTFLITGCGEAGSDTNTGGSAGKAEQGAAEGVPDGDGSNSSPCGSSGGKDIVWQASYTPLERQYRFAFAADQLYGCYDQDGRILLDRMNREAGGTVETLGAVEADWVAGMTADQEGNVYLLGNRGDSTGFWRVDPEGNLQDFAEMELEDTDRAQDLLMKGIYTDQNGNLFVWCEMTVPEIEVIDGWESEVWHWEDRVYIKDGQLKTCFYEKIADMAGTEVLNFQVISGSRPVFMVKDSDGVYLQEIDVVGKGRKDAVRLEKSGDFFGEDGGSSLQYIVPVENGFLCCRNNELFEYHFDTQKAEKLLSLSTFGIFSEDILFLKRNGDVIEIVDNHGNSGRSEFISLTLGKTEKRIVTLGSTEMIPELERVVAEFNRYSGEYRVEIVNYVVREGNYEDAVERLKLDVITGKAPDLITTGGMEYSLLSRKGVLADLYDFMEKDGRLTKDMLVRSVAEACEDGGHLYSVAPGFQLHTVWGYGDVIKGKSGVTFEEFIRLLEDSGKDINAITGFSADEPVLTRLCTVALDEFVDWEKGTCSFDGDYFKRMLSFAGEYTGKDASGTYSERLGRRETVMTAGIISSVADYQIQKELYGGNLDFIGYPAAEGSGTAVALRGSTIAVNALKEDQTGAWEFVKYYLLQGYDGQGFPVLQEQFDRVMAAAMEEDYAVSEDGRTERYSKDYYGDGVISFSVYAAEKEDIDAVTALVESAKNRYAFHTAIQNIINEEAEGYFSGQIDLDKTVGKIQNRVTLLLQESL